MKHQQCSGARGSDNPLEIEIADTQQNVALLEQHDRNCWLLVGHGERTIIVRFTSCSDKRLIYDDLIMKSSLLWI